MFALKQLPTNKTYIIGPLLILLLALCAFLLSNHIHGDLSFQRDLIASGQWWLLFSGHLLHTTDMHLALNSAAVILLWALHGQFFSTTHYLASWLLLALGTSVGLYLFSPDMFSYVGLSGVLHGFFVMGACYDILHKEKTGYLLLLGVAVKLIYEQYYGASEEVVALINANVAVDAHLYGAITGVIIFIAMYAFKRKKRINKK